MLKYMNPLLGEVLSGEKVVYYVYWKPPKMTRKLPNSSEIGEIL